MAYAAYDIGTDVPDYIAIKEAQRIRCTPSHEKKCLLSQRRCQQMRQPDFLERPPNSRHTVEDNMNATVVTWTSNRPHDPH